MRSFVSVVETERSESSRWKQAHQDISATVSSVSRSEASLSFWRTRSGAEVDFVVYGWTSRDELKLEPGAPLELRAREGRLELEPVAIPMRLVRRGKGLVATTDEPLPKIGADDVRAVLESQRR